MGGPGSGRSNARKVASALSNVVKAKPWPWESKRAKEWSREEILAHLCKVTYEAGLSSEHLSDVVSSLATTHWLRIKAIKAIDSGGIEALVGLKPALDLLLNTESRIVQYWAKLGVKAEPAKTRKEAKKKKDFSVQDE